MITLRQINDIDSLLKWRKEVIENVFGIIPDETLLEENKEYYKRHLRDNTHIAFIALKDGHEAGCGSACFSEELPSPDNPNGRCAYLMNIYVKPEFRESGMGHAIVKKLLEIAENRKCGKIYLETTSDGRSLYTSLGFHDLPDMMKFSK